MKHAHDKYSHIQDHKGVIGEDEPVFLLRPTDPIAISLVRKWLEEAQCIPKHKSKIQGVERHLEAMLKWQKANLPKLT